MDTITHGIVGALVGKALFAGHDVPAGLAKTEVPRAESAPAARAAIVACTLGAMFPDIDIFAGPVAHNPLAIMQWHRNITHSAVVLPLWALVLAGLSLPLARLVKWKAPPFWTLFAVYAVALASHVFLDLITNFGTMVWSPLSYTRLAWDWVFILDLTLTSIALVPQFAAWCYREPGQFRIRAVGVWTTLSVAALGAYFFARAAGFGFAIAYVPVVSVIFAAIIFAPALRGAGFWWPRAAWCRAGLSVLCAYIGLAAAAHHKAFADVKQLAAAQHLQVEKLAALPLPPTLTHWVAVVSTPDGVWRAPLQEPSGAMGQAELYADAQALPLVERAMALRDVQIYLWFARFPVWRVHREGDETTVDISDVRFFRNADPLAAGDPQTQTPQRFARSRAGRAGFTFEVIFDAQGHVVSQGFKEPE